MIILHYLNMSKRYYLPTVAQPADLSNKVSEEPRSSETATAVFRAILNYKYC